MLNTDKMDDVSTQEMKIAFEIMDRMESASNKYAECYVDIDDEDLLLASDSAEEKLNSENLPRPTHHSDEENISVASENQNQASNATVHDSVIIDSELTSEQLILATIEAERKYDAALSLLELELRTTTDV